MKKHFPAILAGFSVLMSLVLLIQVFRLEAIVKQDQEQRVQELVQFQNSISDYLGFIGNQTTQALDASKDVNSVVDYFALQPRGLDEETRTLRAGISIHLDEWSDDTTAQLAVTIDRQPLTVPLTLEKGVCTGEMTLPVDAIDRIDMELLTTRGGVHYREKVGFWTNLAGLLPVQHSSFSTSGLVSENGSYTLDHLDFMPISYNAAVPALTETEFHFYQNDTELILSVPTAPARSGDDDIFGALTYDCGPCTIPLTYWHSLNVTFCCRDEYGLHYEFPLYRWYVGPHGEIFSDFLNNHPVELSWD